MSPNHSSPEPTHTTDTPTQIVVCRTRASVDAVIAAHRPGEVSVISARTDLAGATRAWWPLIEQCWDARLASVAADYLTRDLPPNLRLLTPEAATLLAGALHAASLVNWPIVTLTHLLDSGAVATIVELLAGADEHELALDVASVAGPTAPEAEVVVRAAALAARHLDHARLLITGPDAQRSPQQRWGLAGAPTPVVCLHDDASPIAALIIARLRHLSVTDAAATFVEEHAA